MQMLVIGVLALVGLINAGFVQKRMYTTGSLEDNAAKNAKLFLKMFNIESDKSCDANYRMMYHTSLFCGKYDPEYKQCLGFIFVTLCPAYDVCKQFIPHFEHIEMMIDEKCGNIKPEEILTCARKHADKCGQYFENSAECPNVMINFIDWIEGSFDDIDERSRGIPVSGRGLANGDTISSNDNRRLFEYVKSKLSK
jgi:hypothetical protein